MEKELAEALAKVRSLEEEVLQVPELQEAMEKKAADWAALEASWKALLAEKDENTNLLEQKLVVCKICLMKDTGWSELHQLSNSLNLAASRFPCH